MQLTIIFIINLQINCIVLYTNVRKMISYKYNLSFSLITTTTNNNIISARKKQNQSMTYLTENQILTFEKQKMQRLGIFFFVD